MPIKHVNRKGQSFYLHCGSTKTGKPKYFFSMKDPDTAIDAIPDGFEIYENPNGQVFLRKIQEKVITDEEIALVERGIKKFSKLKYFQVEAKKEAIIIHLPNQNVDGLADFLKVFGKADKNYFDKLISYSPMLKFVLVNERERIFCAQRFCFLGSIDDWVDIGKWNTLGNLVKEYAKHLGQESYYSLM
ncbi:MAG: hypothetical protein WC071_13315 [Victivallaceae bacterium]